MDYLFYMVGSFKNIKRDFTSDLTFDSVSIFIATFKLNLSYTFVCYSCNYLLK